MHWSSPMGECLVVKRCIDLSARLHTCLSIHAKMSAPATVSYHNGINSGEDILLWGGLRNTSLATAIVKARNDAQGIFSEQLVSLSTSIQHQSSKHWSCTSSHLREWISDWTLPERYHSRVRHSTNHSTSHYAFSPSNRCISCHFSCKASRAIRDWAIEKVLRTT